VAEVDMSKFADEDQEEEEEPKSYHIKPQVSRVFMSLHSVGFRRMQQQGSMRFCLQRFHLGG
jgi:hypothetical protein